MSPPAVGMFEASVAIVERDSAIKTLTKLIFCAGETETAVLRRDLEATALPLHDVVVVADATFVQERTNANKSVWGGTLGVARGALAEARSQALARRSSLHRCCRAARERGRISRQVLADHFDPKFDPSLAIRSAYGRWLSWLQLIDRAGWKRSCRGRSPAHKTCVISV